MPNPHIQFEEACCSGDLNADDWCDSLIEFVSDPTISNQGLVEACSAACRGLDAPARLEWMDNLIEFSLWESGKRSDRLSLCDYAVREGLAPFDSPRRWRFFGGLLHVACEGASIDGVRWALEHQPGAAMRRGGGLGVWVVHALCNRGPSPDAVEIWEMLSAHGARADLATGDGQNALFRCEDSALAARLMLDGADPWAPDLGGFTAVGRWLETAQWPCVEAAFAARPADLERLTGWGEFSGRDRSGPARHDRPLFIAACSRVLRGQASAEARDRALSMLVALGADPLARDEMGRSLFERSGLLIGLSLQEHTELERASASGTHSKPPPEALRL